MDNDKPLNYRQNFFAEYYAEGETQGNAYKSAIKAGYSHKFALQAAPRLLENVRVKAQIDEINAKNRAESVATRKLRQEFWTRIMNDPATKMSDRLRASELLGKSEADFTENYTDNTDEPPEALTAEEVRELREAMEIVRRSKLKLHQPETCSVCGYKPCKCQHKERTA